MNRQDYELFETLASTNQHYRRLWRDMEELDGPRGFDLPGNNLRIFFEEATKDMNAFILMENPDEYARAMELHKTFAEDPEDYTPDYRYLAICKKTVDAFAAKLFQADLHAVVASFKVDIQRHEVIFDEHFLDDFPKRDKLKSWTSDATLCEEMTKIDKKIIVVDAGDREIPYAMEARAIRSMHLLTDRPLITVIGGCRDAEIGGEDASGITTMCDGIIQAAHRLKANVVPPGTQSGIGTVLGRASVAYDQQTEDLPAQNRARFFAVSPGGETYYPGNQNIAPESEKEACTYAIAPIDSILTPFQAGWDWTGERKKDAPYFRHIEYAEAIYNRVSAGQPRVTVIGNGGLFTIVEANAALKNDSSIILVKDTGRFADLAIRLETNRTALSALDEPHWEKAVLHIIQTRIPQHSRTSLLHSYGEAETITPEQTLYRNKLREYFILSAGNDIRFAKSNELETVIDTTVQNKRSDS